MVIVLMIIGIFSLMVFPAYEGLYDKILLETTANKIKSSLLLAQQLSLNESMLYCVEIINEGRGFRIREDKFQGKVIFVEKLNKKIKFDLVIHCYKITYSRKGVPNYGKFIISNEEGEKIKIETLIGTGRVQITKMY
ncbi:hypothetical protein FQB35_06960 [Crassaminicella thermophila]|uniref:Tfp pilus assembly protein FimT n=2 Tax=Crassaminicella thermophila TaxID=2599308 RepID=A0A5C0SGI4_CRATE|nr:hypothetical protein FQB35_06960 [Crassaminicella thermophila]